MKKLLFLFLCFAPFSTNAQQPFSPIPFELNDRYASEEELYATPTIKIQSTLNGVFFYQRHDSHFIAYWDQGYLTEFIIPKQVEIDFPHVTSFEFLEDEENRGLLLIKTSHYQANTGSAWTTWFESRLHWTIINLETPAVIFDADVSRTYHEENYTYAKDISDESISEKEIDELIATRKVTTINCHYAYQIELEQKLMRISCQTGCEQQENNCHSRIKEGEYMLKYGAYQDFSLRQPKVTEELHLVDTILEKNNPKALDFSMHQLFIDTTRRNSFYTYMKEWVEIESEHYKQYFIPKLYQTTPSVAFTSKSFPTHFITLRKLKDQFYLYKPCDGSDTKLEIKDSLAIFYFRHETQIAMITKVIQVSPHKVKLRLLQAQPSSTETFELMIEKLQDHVYKLTETHDYGDIIIYLTPAMAARNFDLVVNHCPTQKVREYQFDDSDDK